MSAAVLAYSLFSPKVLPQHRLHDTHRTDASRYWFNLPAVVLTNAILYPAHEMRLYITPNILEHELAPILSIMKRQPNFTYQVVDMEYDATEPAIWRIMPLWEAGIETFHTRDIDSIPTEIEYRYTLAFEKSRCAMGTLRTHAHHYGIKCRMLAGLSSFRPNQIPYQMKYNNFYTYYAMRHGNYGSDQDLMIQQFTTDPLHTQDNFYDHHAYAQKNKQDFPCRSATDRELEEVTLSGQQKTILQTLKSEGLDNWAGEPVDARGPYTNHLLSHFPTVEREIKSSNTLRSFYIRGEA